MIKLLKFFFINEAGGLGITRLSMVTAVCADTGDDSDDAVVKVRRLINQRGRQFCKITNWPFMRDDSVSFNITNAGSYKYSGSSYLPDTFKRVVTAFIKHNNKRYPLTEVGIKKATLEWADPDSNEGMPDEFCITRIESGYWQIQFNRTPDQTYTVYFEIELQWADLTADTSETLITKDYYDAFVLYVDIARYRQQGDMENFSIASNEWWRPRDPQCVLSQILADLGRNSKNKQIVINPEYINSFAPDVRDYSSQKRTW